jgi:hypothetical protein
MFLKVKSRACLFEVFSLIISTTLLLVVILGFGNSVVCLFICQSSFGDSIYTGVDIFRVNSAAIYTGLGYAMEVWVKLWSVIVLFTRTMATTVCCE